jgi:hypothetical protein
LIEVLALDPELIFTGGIAGVLAAFEHSDYHDLDNNRFAGRPTLGREL